MYQMRLYIIQDNIKKIFKIKRLAGRRAAILLVDYFTHEWYTFWEGSV